MPISVQLRNQLFVPPTPTDDPAQPVNTRGEVGCREGTISTDRVQPSLIPYLFMSVGFPSFMSVPERCGTRRQFPVKSMQVCISQECRNREMDLHHLF